MRFIAYILTAFFFICATYSNAANKSTVKAGNWNDPTVWSGGSVPVNGDKITLGHTVTVDGVYNYNNSDVIVGWAGALIIPVGNSLHADDLNVSNGGGVQSAISGSLTVDNDFIFIGGTFFVDQNASVLVSGTLDTGGGSTTTMIINGLMELGALDNGSDARITVGLTGTLLIHGDYTNSSGSEITINGGDVTIEGSYINSGDGLITINDGGNFIVEQDMSNTGGSSIVVNDGSVVILGDMENLGGSDFEIADGSTVDVAGDLSNSGGGTIVVDGYLNVDGTLTNKGGGSITGDGTITAGVVDDRNGGIDPNLLLPSGLFLITSGNWEDGANWSTTNGGASCSCTPETATDVTIPAGFTVTVNSAAEISQLLVEATATVNIEAVGGLKLNDALLLNGKVVLKNSATSSAYLLDNGTITAGAGAVTETQLFLDGNAYHYISSAIPNVATSSIQYIGGYLNRNVYQYNETAADNWGDAITTNDFAGWVAPAAALNTAEGFAVYVPYDYTFTLSGNIFHTGNYSTNISLTNIFGSTYDGWNMVGNPYPSGIDAVSFLSDNASVTDGNLWLWDDDHSTSSDFTTDYSSADYIQINQVGAISPSQSGSAFNGIVSANQAFIVKSLVSSGALNFANTQRRASASDLLKRGNESTENAGIEKIKLSLAATQNSLYNETLIAFLAEASDELDNGFDGIKRKGNPNIAFYSISGEFDLGIQSLPAISQFVELDLGYDCNIAGEYSIAIKEFNFTAAYDIILKDKMLGISTNLREGAYVFSSANGQFRERFSLLISQESASDVTLSAKDEQQPVKIMQSNQNLIIMNNSDEDIHQGYLRIIDLRGKVVFSVPVSLAEGEQKNIEIPKFTGFYVSDIIENKEQKAKQKLSF